MSLNLTNLFTSLGKIGSNGYLIASGQATQAPVFGDLAGEGWLNPEWIGSLALSYDSLLRNNSAPMATWSQTAAQILQSMVAAENPTYGTSLPAALTFLLNEMRAQSASVAACTVSAASAAYSDNVGTGFVFVTVQRADGLIQQNLIAEETTLLITSDSYTGNATVNQEPWTWTGAPNNSSLGTGVQVGLWDWDWPQGSAAFASGTAIAATDNPSGSNSYLANGNYQTWTSGGTPILANWHLSVGTWGTSIQRATGGIAGAGTYCVQFNTGATLNALTQQFNSSVSDGTDATAGTTIKPPPLRSYTGNIFLKAAGVISGGEMKVEVVDGSGTVIQDQQGVDNVLTIDLSAHPTVWTQHPYAFRFPAILPAVVRLRIRISTALAGAALYLDWATFTAPVNLYRGGASATVFSNPESPFEANPEADGFTLTFANNRAGSQYGATFQTLLNRLFQTPDFLAPYSNSPTIPDTLIITHPGTTFHTYQLRGPEPSGSPASGWTPYDASALPYTFNVVQDVGSQFGTPGAPLTSRIEESADGLSGWVTIGNFANVSTHFTQETITVTRTKQYVRWFGGHASSGGGFYVGADIVTTP